ncbi:MAG: chemotaxis protein CheA, partial [Bacillota bacterium]|nr:chemotaxis protein CheA [Bacillota bacterium]
MSDQYTNDPLLEMFLYETTQNLEQLEQIIMSSEKMSQFSPESINEIFRIMHTIKGSAAMMEFANISTLAHKVEDMFFYIRENNLQKYDCSAISDLILSSVDFFNEQLENIKDGNGSSEEATDLTEKIADVLDTLKQENSDEAPGAKGAKKSKKASKAAPGGAVASDANRFQVKFFFEDDCQMENIRAFSLIYQLNEIADEVTAIPDDTVESEAACQMIRARGLILSITTNKSYEDIKQFFDNTVLMKKYSLSSEDASKPELEKATEQVAEIAQSAAKETADTQNGPKDHNAPVVQSIISVNVDKVDTLMDLIGELVIAESMVTQNPDLADLPLENFKNASRQLHKITNDLQDLAMSIRLVPLKPTFQKMSRIVRDMSKKLDKNVQLKMVGDDTEVDKNIIDHISDPLMHLVRNSLDHGIESAEERKASGKPVVASVTLEAKNDGGEVVVAVTDDGKGLNKEKILKRARENNLLTKPESELTDKEIYSMIFLPGFSTNDNVTEFSGRGVGMDVVLKNIEAVNGRVSVDSMPGIGTRTTIRFPLTLSIIEGMSIRVGSAKYAVPITSIRESFKPQ